MNLTGHRYPKRLGSHLYLLMKRGVTMHGTFNPDEIFYIFEEDLTGPESKTAYGFLSWVHANGKQYGSGNYEEVYAEFLASGK